MIIITGATGFLGKAVADRVHGARGLSSEDLDLTNGAAVMEAFARWRPRVVIHLAARVGGITENIARQADFLIDNTRIDANLLAAIRESKPDHFIPLLSTCMYPDQVPDVAYPMTEGMIEDGAPPPTNAAYAAAKRTLMHGTRALHAQYGIPYSAIIPANLYGPGDHFGEGKSHFLAAAIHRIEAARISRDAQVTFMGTGKALRQYVFVDDVAQLIATLVQRDPLQTAVNVAPERNRSIKELAHLVADAVGFEGSIEFSDAGPDGQYRKDVSNQLLRQLVPEWEQIETHVEEGLAATIHWYRKHVAPSS